MVDVGFAAMPPDDVKNLLIELSGLAGEEFRMSYGLGNAHHPHLSLYQGTFRGYQNALKPFDSADLFYGLMEKALIVPEKLQFWDSGYITLKCEKTDGLQELHEAVLASVCEARDSGAVSIWERNSVPLTPREQENVRKYGYHAAYELFDPHYTIGRTNDRSLVPPDSQRGMHRIVRRFIGKPHFPADVVIYQIGPDGSCMNPRSIFK